MRVRVGIVATDIVELLCVVWEREVLYARFSFCRDGFRAFDKVRESDFFHAEEEVLVGVLGVMGVERSVGVRGGFEWEAVWAKGSESRKECVDVAEAENVREEREFLVDVTREARREDLRCGWETVPVVGRLIIEALVGMAGV